MHLTSDEIVIKSLAIESLRGASTTSSSGSGGGRGGSIQAKGVLIDGAELINTKIKSSTMYLSSSPSGSGDLAVRRAVSVYAYQIHNSEKYYCIHYSMSCIGPMHAVFILDTAHILFISYTTLCIRYILYIGRVYRLLRPSLP